MTNVVLTWEKPECQHQNGPLKQIKYEYKLWPVNISMNDDAYSWNETRLAILQLSGLREETLYGFKVRAVHPVGAGPSSETILVKTRKFGRFTFHSLLLVPFSLYPFIQYYVHNFIYPPTHILEMCDE